MLFVVVVNILIRWMLVDVWVGIMFSMLISNVLEMILNVMFSVLLMSCVVKLIVMNGNKVLKMVRLNVIVGGVVGDWMGCK